MAIRLTREQVTALKQRTELIVARPVGCWNVHVRLRIDGPAFCGYRCCRTDSWPPHRWSDPFCAKCVKMALQ